MKHSTKFGTSLKWRMNDKDFILAKYFITYNWCNTTLIRVEVVDDKIFTLKNHTILGLQFTSLFLSKRAKPLQNAVEI